MSTTPFWNLPNSYSGGVPVSSAGLDAQANISEAQTVAALRFLAPGVYPHPPVMSWKVAAVSGLNISVAGGAGIAASTAYGMTALYDQTGLASLTLPDNSTNYVFAQVWVQTGVNDSRVNLLPQYVHAITSTLDGGVPLAKVVTSGGSISSITDVRDWRNFLCWQGAYSANVIYSANDVVTYTGNVWVSLGDSNVNNTPTEGAHWTAFTASGGTPLNWRGTWNSGTAYVPNDAVDITIGGITSSYICILSNTNESPPNATYWSVLASGGTNGAGYDGVSTTSLTIGTGTKTLILQPGLAYAATNNIIIVDSATPANSMTGNVTSYDKTTGIMVAAITDFTGSGTFTTWDVTLTGAQGVPGIPGGVINWVGAWGTGNTYSVNDGVADGTPQSSYRCILGNTSASGNEPGAGGGATYWAIIAEAGATGSTGATGATGAAGSTGPTGAGYGGSSTTSLTIGTGTKTLTLQSGKAYQINDYVLVSDQSDATNVMFGVVTTYDIATGIMTFDCTVDGGSGTIATWYVAISGPQGPTGATGSTGATGPTGPGYGGTSTDSLTIATGSTSLTTQAGLAYSAGARLRLSDSSDPTKWMEGVITSYSSTTLVFDVDLTQGTGTIATWDLNIAGQPALGGNYEANIGDGSTNPIPVVHNLDSEDVLYTFYEISTGNQVFPTVVVTDANTLTVSFSPIATSNQYRVVVSLPGGGNGGAAPSVSGLQYYSPAHVLTYASTTNIDWNNGNTQEITLTADVTFTFSNAQPGATYRLWIYQDATGGWDATWPTSFWAGGLRTLSGVANGFDIAVFVIDNSGTIAGSMNSNFS